MFDVVSEFPIGLVASGGGGSGKLDLSFLHKGSSGTLSAASEASAASDSPMKTEESEVSNLAKRVPKVRPSGNTDLDMQRQIERDGLVWVIDTLSKNRHLVAATKGFLERELRRNSEVSSKDLHSSSFPAEYKYFSKLPRYWYANWIVTESAGELSADAMGKLELADSAQLRRIFDFLTVTNGGHAWPPCALSKSVLSKMMTARASEVGKRVKGFFAKALRPDFLVDWSVCGPYQLVWQEHEKHGKRACQIRHISGVVASVPDEVVLSPAFELVNGWCDATAAVSKPPIAEYKLLNFFVDRSKPPHTLIMEKKASRLQQLAQEQAQATEEAEKALTANVVPDDVHVLEGAAAEKRKAALEKARASLATRELTKRARTRQVLSS